MTCDRCGGEAAELIRRSGRKICGECDQALTDETTLVGTARIPIFAGAGS